MKTPLWTLHDIITATRGEAVGVDEQSFNGLSIDSRTVGVGDVFLAIKGDVFDGHDFVEKALGNGASLALVSRNKFNEHRYGKNVCVVDDVEEAMRSMARFARARFQGKVVAVTGSVGKTTSKEMLRCAFSALGKTHAAVASFNNHWGVPLTLARMPADFDYAVIEIGMNHNGEIIPLVGMTKPDVVMISAIEPVHIEHFKSLADIADAKGEIFSGLGMGGAAVLPFGHALLERMKMHLAASKASRLLLFGFDERADGFVKEQNGLLARVRICSQDIDLHLKAAGQHMLSNALGVLCVGHALGDCGQEFVRGLSAFEAVQGRGKCVEWPLKSGGTVTVIDESYNANPASMRSALGVLANFPKHTQGRRIAILGQMLELGEQSKLFHEQLAPVVIDSNVDTVFACGAGMSALYQNLPESVHGAFASTAQELFEPLLSSLKDKDVLMFKGSHGSQVWKLVETMQKHLLGEEA